jgi:hypothetical protein
MSDKPAVFFYEGDSELLATKPVNVTAININNYQEKDNALNEIGKNLDSVPCVFVRGVVSWVDENTHKEYVLPEQWIFKNLDGVTNWGEVGLVPTVPKVVEPVVEAVVEPVVEAVVEAVVEPVVEPVVEAVVE